jgi:hypothetical protein
VECLDENTLDELVAGRLTRAHRQDVEVHVDGCGDCRRLVANHLKESYAPFDEPTVVEGRHGIETAPTLRMMRRAPDEEPPESSLVRSRFDPGRGAQRARAGGLRRARRAAHHLAPRSRCAGPRPAAFPAPGASETVKCEQFGA